MEKDNISDKELDDFKEQLEDLHMRQVCGEVNGFEFRGGPHNGKEFIVKCHLGEPIKDNIWIAIPSMWEWRHPVKCANYIWDYNNKYFLFSGKVMKKNIISFLDKEKI